MQLLTLEMEGFFEKTKLEKLERHIAFSPSDIFILFFSCDADIM